MKYLSDYLKDATTELLDSTGSFFAFGDKQFEEAKKEGVTYVSMGMGLICPKDQADYFHKAHAEIYKAGVKKDLEENGKEGVIKRELANHECYYTGEIEQCADALNSYGITNDEIMAVYREQRTLQNT